MTNDNKNISGPRAAADRARIIAFLRYALDDVAAVSRRSAFFLRMTIQSLEEEERGDLTAIDVHDIGGT